VAHNSNSKAKHQEHYKNKKFEAHQIIKFVKA